MHSNFPERETFFSRGVEVFLGKFWMFTEEGKGIGRERWAVGITDFIGKRFGVLVEG